MKIKYLYQENGFLYFRNNKGQINKHPKPKFKDNEIVTTTEKHYSIKNITRLKKPSFTENRGWVYIENFINIQGSGGGSGMWNKQDDYKKITDPKFLMIAKRIELKESILKAKNRIKTLESNLDKLEFTMDLVIKDYRTATHSCKKCGNLFKGFEGGDPNKDLCTECLSKK